MNELRKEILEALDEWVKSVNSLDPEEVVKNYSTDAMLWGTVSQIIRPCHRTIKDYFAYFLGKNPKVHISDEPEIRIYGEIAISNGHYAFTFDNIGEKIRNEARFSFVYQKQNGKWMIVNHHSSFRPN